MSRNFSHPIGLYFESNLPVIKGMVAELKKHEFEDLGLVCTGSSGAIIAGVIASMLDKAPSIIYIRKDGEFGHYHSNENKLRKVKDLVFVDDFISSGNTVNYVIKELKKTRIYSIRGICIEDECGLNKIKDSNFFKEYFIPTS